MSEASKHHMERMSTFVTRERVIAPPDRFISGVQDEELLSYFRGACRAGLSRLLAARPLPPVARAGCSRRGGFRPPSKPEEQSIERYFHSAA